MQYTLEFLVYSVAVFFFLMLGSHGVARGCDHTLKTLDRKIPVVPDSNG